MEYKNLYTYKEFLNEGLFNFLKNLFKNLQKYGEKIKESKEIDKKIDEYKKELDKLFEEQFQDKLKDMASEILKSAGVTKSTQTTGTTTQSGTTEKIGESFNLYEAQNKKVQKVQKEIKYNNPIDESIGEFMNNKKEMLKQYLNSKNEKVLLYAQAKISELNQYILQKKVEFYKKNKNIFGDEGLVKIVELETKKLKESQTKSQEILKKLDLVVGKDDKKDIIKGEVGGNYIYPSESAKKDINVELIEDQNNITEKDKKEDNNNTQDESEKWVKVKSDNSEFYVKKGVLKKIK